MSDFLFSSAPQAPGTLRGVLAAYLDAVSAEYREWHGPWGSLAVALAAHDGAVVHEDARGLSVLVGRPLLSIAPHPRGFADAEPLRGALHRVLADAADAETPWDRHLDGPAALLWIDRREPLVRVVLDLMAWIPVFRASADGPDGARVVAGTHVDAVAQAAGLQHRIDPVSAVDLLRNETIVFPHTLYPGVEQLAPGTEYRLQAEGEPAPERRRAYWAPREQAAFPSLAEAAAALRERLLANVREACAGHERVALLLSAGEDSRAVLGAVPEGVRVDAFTFSDRENREVRVARRVARAYGARFWFRPRRPNHYLGAFETVTRLVGSQHRFADVHAFGYHSELELGSYPVVLGGLSADVLLKGQYAPPSARFAARGDAGRGDPRLRAGSLPGVRTELLEQVAERRRARWSALRALRPQSAAEWAHLWPFSTTKASANLHGNRRLFRVHEPFQSSAVVRLAAEVPLDWKTRGRLFLRAMHPLFAPAWRVPHLRPRFPYFGRGANLVLGAGLATGRAVRDALAGDLRANQGGWPRAGAMVGSEPMRRAEQRYRLEESPLGGLFTPSPAEAAELAARHWTPTQRLMLLELAYVASWGPAEGLTA